MIKVYSRILHLLVKLNPIICSLVVSTSALASNVCRRSFYQEKEPEGLAEFKKDIKNEKGQ